MNSSILKKIIFFFLLCRWTSRGVATLNILLRITDWLNDLTAAQPQAFLWFCDLRPEVVESHPPLLGVAELRQGSWLSHGTGWTRTGTLFPWKFWSIKCGDVCLSWSPPVLWASLSHLWNGIVSPLLPEDRVWLSRWLLENSSYCGASDSVS